MSKFLDERYASLAAYVPGEQPQDKKYIKLNTNESPYPPSPETLAVANRNEAELLRLYPDPDGKVLTEKLARLYNVKKENIFLANGSDDILNFAFMAYCANGRKSYFADITYGFYSVFANLHGSDYTEIPLEKDFSIDYEKFCGVDGGVFIANPNAPTGLALSLDKIEKVVKSNPDNVVVVDEAYVDFGAESAVTLVDRYDNLLVTQTFSKSRSMAGARLGFGIGNEKLIADLNTIKYSTNPYNVNRMTEFAGVAALEDHDYYMNNARIIMDNRQWTKETLEGLGFTVLDSKANFLFAKHSRIDGEALYLELKKRGVLVRHFTKPRIAPYVRITVGTRAQMEILIENIKKLLEA